MQNDKTENPNPGPLTVSRADGDRYAVVLNDTNTATGTWEERYVQFSGFFGSYGPDMFAAAPDMLAILLEARDKNVVVEDANWWGRLFSAIEKAEGKGK